MSVSSDSSRAGVRGAIATAARVLSLCLFALIDDGRLVVTDRGRRRAFGAGDLRGELVIRSSRAWSSLLRGSRGLADAYAAGWWESPDLVALIRVAARNAGRLDQVRRWLAPFRALRQQFGALLPGNTRRRSRRDIAAHYDLGNQLFARMLDRTMSYSCAVFEHPDMTLEEAQETKLEKICRKLELRPDDHLLEIGTGWGSLALHAAQTRGCQVTTTTISREQHAYTTQRVRDAGLEDRVTVLLEDYRDLRGSYDKLASVEMIEAVGWRHTGRFFSICSELLNSDGRMLLQAITIEDRAYHVEKASKSFMNTRIFPGASLPSLESIARCVARHTNLQAIGVEDLTPHYVDTLRHWRDAFCAHEHELDALGYDERFRRLWRLYLSYCEAGFAERRIQDVQIVLARPQAV